jgi:beta-aspartyl-dipeptidase (metallo-type)
MITFVILKNKLNNMILLKNCRVYSPADEGRKDILLSAGKIAKIADDLSRFEVEGVEVLDMQGRTITPGFIDLHVHIAGAGGEGGPSSRTGELQLSHFLRAGVTSVVGCLGTDGITRSVEEVLMKAKGLKDEGISCWIFTGAYQVPTTTLTGSVAKDLAMFEEVIGVGEVALSDHRSSHPDTNALIKLATDARVGGMLGAKSGIVHIHMGDAKNPFAPIHKAVEESELKYSQFFPTHCNRNDHIFRDALEYGKLGPVDITASSYPYFPEYEVKPSKAVKAMLENGVPLQNITMSSDGGGSLPDFDDHGNLVKLERGFPDSILKEFKDAILDDGMKIQDILPVITSNPARILKLKGKGHIAEGMDADIIAFNEAFEIHDLFARGVPMIRQGKLLKKGSYEAD